MKANDQCLTCGRAIRWAILESEGTVMMMEPQASVHGQWGVVKWKPEPMPGIATPIMGICLDGRRRTETPFRYIKHECADD